MVPQEGKTEDVSSDMEGIAEKILVWAGIISLFIGFAGLIMVVTYPEVYGDHTLQFVVAFVYSYMIILGIFLIVYHGKIIVRGHPT